MMMAGKPVGEVQQQAPERIGLGSAQQEADDGEGHRTRDQGGQLVMIPQLIMIRAIHSLAPTFSRITLLGTSNMK